MTPEDAYDLMVKILQKHDASVNEDDGGERPFNREGDTLEALYAVYDGDIDRARRAGWFD